MDYKTTLNLPRTAFPMKAELSKKEPEILKGWEESDIYRLIQEKSKGRKKYILHDGPPYANGNIHIGHALNKTLKDIIVKYKTMRGFDCAYVPGWDCHGLPVEHQLFKELGIHKSQVSQVEFRKKAYDYAMRFVAVQKEEFKRLGVFGDWENPYLTLSSEYEEAIVRSFAALVRQGYIYRGLKPVNWCYKCETALAEAEVEYEDHASLSIYVKFELLNPQPGLRGMPQGKKAYAIVWTTTPWTLIANVAIAVHPDFKYCGLEVGDEVWLIQEDLAGQVLERIGIKEYRKIDTILGKVLDGVPYADIFQPSRNTGFKFVLADYVSKEEGTGLVHTAPGHGQEDYLTGQRYHLETVMPVDRKGEFFQDVAMEFKGMHVFAANKDILEKLKSQGNLLYAGTITHTYPHCWRCKTPIIFRATEQWFLGIDKHGLRKKLLETVDKEVTWVPAAGKERISAMIELRPDWCLSRQRYWGVPIPALKCERCGREFLFPEVIDRFAAAVLKEGSDAWFIKDVSEFLPIGLACPECKNDTFAKCGDILDVWFDSGVSHQAVLKKRKDLEFPCALYLEGSDQHRGWFQSSLIPALCIDGKSPFRTVLTHGHVVDGEGRKMSKSMGNVIAPQDVMKDSGADMIRLWVAFSDYNEDIRISPQILARLSEAYRKIRNTVRFMLSNLLDFHPDTDNAGYEQMRKIDKWILFRLAQVRSEAEGAYEAFQFSQAYKIIYDFCNEDLSMHYLDMIKGRLYTFAACSPERRGAQTVMYEILDALLRLISPILVFTSEEIWQHMPRKKQDSDVTSVHMLAWPEENTAFSQKCLPPAQRIDTELQAVMDLIPEVAKALEEKRGVGAIGSSFDAKIILLTKDDFRYKYFKSLPLGELEEIFKVSQVEVEKKDSFDKCVASHKYPDVAIIVEPAGGSKCVRCWNYSLSVGECKKHLQLCQRCRAAIGEE